MKQKILANLVLLIGAVILGVMGGLLYVMYYFKFELEGNQSKYIQTVKEKTVYLEESAYQDSIAKVTDSIWYIFSKDKLEEINTLLGSEKCKSDLAVCLAEGKTAVIVFADGVLMSAKIDSEKSEYLARDVYGNVVNLEKIADSAEFSFWKAIISPETENKIVFKPVELADPESWSIAQQLFKIDYFGNDGKVLFEKGLIQNFGWSRSNGVVTTADFGKSLILTSFEIANKSPIFDLSGKLMAWQSESKSIAIDILQIKSELMKVKNGKKSELINFGANFLLIDRQRKQSLNLDSDQGFLVVDQFGKISGKFIEPNSPAQKIGLEPGDIILTINGDSPASNLQLLDILGRLTDGDSIKVKIIRQGKTINLES